MGKDFLEPDLRSGPEVKRGVEMRSAWWSHERSYECGSCYRRTC
jgi:hypothetical protein